MQHVIRIRRGAFQEVMESVGARPPESGGILLGPVGCPDITQFHFDHSGSATSATYTPDHIALQQLMKEMWLPSGLDMKGFVHSHPGAFDRLSAGDLAYIRRLLAANQDMEQFAAPIVIPKQFRLRGYLVLRSQPQYSVSAGIEFL